MNLIKYILVLLFLTAALYPQQSTRSKLLKLKNTNGIKVTELQNNMLKIEYRNGKTVYKNIGEYKETAVQNTLMDSTEIDLTTIDTSLYSFKYRFWREVPVSAGQVGATLVNDADRNGRAELYGFRKDFATNNDSLKLKVFEYQPLDSSFSMIYTYGDTVGKAQQFYDIKGIGEEELFATNTKGAVTGFVFKTNTTHSLATTPDFTHYALSQMNDPQFADLNNNGITDLLYYCLVDSGFTIISEYNSQFNRLDSVYSFHQNDLYAAGFSHADIDGDGYPDIVEATVHGKVYVIEYQPGSGYKNVWNGKVETYNAYLHTSTHDIDKNGKPEFWVGGDATYNGVAKTRLTCFEATGNNTYTPVARIDLVGVMSFYAGNIFALDVDKDGTEELCLCIDGNFIILKFVGSPEHHAYETYYIKKTELPDSGFTYLGGSMYDILTNGKEAILINMFEDPPQPDYIRYFTRIYLPESLSGITDPQRMSTRKFQLEQNYPNPFNPTTNIKFSIEEYGRVTITIYNVLGKEVRQLIDKDIPPGEHTIVWNARDNANRDIPGGVYFIKMTIGSYQKLIKSIFLK